MLQDLRSFWNRVSHDTDVRKRVDAMELPFNGAGVDPYGISKAHLSFAFSLVKPFYEHYFRMRVFGIENVPKRGRGMLVGNHAGGVALDGLMVIASMFFEMNPPRLAQGMADKFINRAPFASLWSNRCGQFTGLPEHAERLLGDERLLMVFPEGANGTAKLYPERHSLVKFGSGFVRLAMKTKTPIIPFAFLGGGDAIPTVMNSELIGKMVGAPYFPVTPYGLPLPLPTALELYYGSPIVLEGTGAEDDRTIFGHVDRVRSTIATMLEAGVARRSA